MVHKNNSIIRIFENRKSPSTRWGTTRVNLVIFLRSWKEYNQHIYNYIKRIGQRGSLFSKLLMSSKERTNFISNFNFDNDPRDNRLNRSTPFKQETFHLRDLLEEGPFYIICFSKSNFSIRIFIFPNATHV